MNVNVFWAIGNNDRPFPNVIVGNLLDNLVFIDLVQRNVTFASAVMNEALIKIAETTKLEGLLYSLVFYISTCRGDSHGFSEKLQVSFVDLIQLLKQSFFLFVFLLRVQFFIFFNRFLFHINFSRIVPPFPDPEVAFFSLLFMTNVLDVRHGLTVGKLFN